MNARQRIYAVTVFISGMILVATCGGAAEEKSLLSAVVGADRPTIVFILQHAERGEFTKENDDPELTAEGKERAKELAHTLGNAGIAAIFAPKAQRMTQTVQPLLESLKLPELIYYDSVNPGDMIRQIKERYAGKTVLIVGAGVHMGSGGIHDIIKMIGCTSPECDAPDSFDNLTAVIVYGPDKTTALKLKYGKPPAPAK
jgi:hypothetical protein